MSLYQLVCAALFLFCISYNVKAIEENKPHFVILIYHHVSDDTPPSTTISPEQFAAHLAHLDQYHNVISLDNALAALENNTQLPEKSVVITFDDGYANILENGYPLLQKYNFPFTVFIDPKQTGKYANQLSWSQIRQMQPLATYANHTIGHLHLLDKEPNESEDAWLKRVMDNIENTEELLKENLGYSKRWLAYPYGEFNNTLKNALNEAGYISFGQQSGAVATYSDLGAIPRFPAAGIYANIKTLKVKLNSLAMPVKSITPSDTVFLEKDIIESFSLELSDTPDLQVQQFNCFFQNNPLRTEINNWNVSIEFGKELSPGRHRINCTSPSKSQKGRFYWYSIPIFVPTIDGKFLD